MRRHLFAGLFVLVVVACAVVLMLAFIEQSSTVHANSANSDSGVLRFRQRSSDLQLTPVVTQYVYLPLIVAPLPVIMGRVTQDGAPLAGATVGLLKITPSIMHPSTITTTVTDENGNYPVL